MSISPRGSCLPIIFWLLSMCSHSKKFLPLCNVRRQEWSYWTLIAGVLSGLLFFMGDVQGASLDSWGPVVELRDDTEGTSKGKPPGGWWVTPIHATLLPSGEVLITGWSRRDRHDCTQGGFQRNGTTFILDPSTLTESTVRIISLDEQNSSGGDVLFCSGHVPLSDERIFYAGGQRHAVPDRGLNYARLFQIQKKTFSRIETMMRGGPVGEQGVRWYPTATRLPDSRVMVTGGFTRFGHHSFGNLSIELFDERAFDAGTHPWKLLVSHDGGVSDMTPGLHDYTHVYVLPDSVPDKKDNGIARQVAMLGGAGTMLLLNTDDDLEERERLMAPPHGQRQGGGDGSSGALLSTGEILVLGGTDEQGTSQRADFYNPQTDTWSFLDTHIGRWHPTSVLLSDGTVLIVNGESKPGFLGDPRRPQTIDPVTQTITTASAWPDDSRMRGYHNIAILLKDGRVLLGGGVDPEHSVQACERPDVRIYSPAYLEKGPRPTLVDVREPVQMAVGGPEVSVQVTNGAIRSGNGVVLMALGSVTHAFDQNQRYIPLEFTESQAGSINISPPVSYQHAPPGNYMLYVVNEEGVPSNGKHVLLK